MTGAYSRYPINMATVGWCLLAFPFSVYYALLLYSTVAWHQVGHFPYYGHPDPKDMGLNDLVYMLVFLLLMIGKVLSWLGSLAALPLMLAARLERRTPLRNVCVALLMCGLHIWFISTDPLGLWEWLAD